MTDESLLTIHPVPAPRAVTQTHPQYRGYRFFAAFFPTRIDGVRAEAQDSSGQTLERARSHFGIFIPIQDAQAQAKP